MSTEYCDCAQPENRYLLDLYEEGERITHATCARPLKLGLGENVNLYGLPVTIAREPFCGYTPDYHPYVESCDHQDVLNLTPQPPHGSQHTEIVLQHRPADTQLWQDTDACTDQWTEGDRTEAHRRLNEIRQPGWQYRFVRRTITVAEEELT
jgi:hypothetical protein